MLRQTTSDESWTATTENSVTNANPSRTTESHAKSGNRSVDKQTVEVLGPNGGYQPDFETEKETVRVDATTTRTVVRTYFWDENRRRKLAQVTEEEARSTASGDAQVVRTTSSSDLNGNLRVVQREAADTRKTSPDVQETKTTIYLADGNGGFTTARQTQELQMHSADHKLEEKKTTLLPDGNGNWKVGEVKERTIQEDGKNRTIEERVSRPDSDGRLSECFAHCWRRNRNRRRRKNQYRRVIFYVCSWISWRRQPASERASHDRPEKEFRRRNNRAAGRAAPHPVIPAPVCKSPQERNISCSTLLPARSRPQSLKSVTSTAHSTWSPRRGLNQTRFPPHVHRQHP